MIFFCPFQCDVTSKLDCKKYSGTSCQYVEMMVEQKLLVHIQEVQNKHKHWRWERQLQGT